NSLNDRYGHHHGTRTGATSATAAMRTAGARSAFVAGSARPSRGWNSPACRRRDAARLAACLAIGGPRNRGPRFVSGRRQVSPAPGHNSNGAGPPDAQVAVVSAAALEHIGGNDPFSFFHRPSHFALKRGVENSFPGSPPCPDVAPRRTPSRLEGI